MSSSLELPLEQRQAATARAQFLAGTGIGTAEQATAG